MYIYIYRDIYIDIDIHRWNGLLRYFRCISHRFSSLFIGDVCLENYKISGNTSYLLSFGHQKIDFQQKHPTFRGSFRNDHLQPTTPQARNPTPRSKDRSRPAEFSQTANYESNWRCKPVKKRCNVHDQNRGHPILYLGVNSKITIKIGMLTISKMGIQQSKNWGLMRSMTTQAVLRYSGIAGCKLHVCVLLL